MREEYLNRQAKEFYKDFLSEKGKIIYEKLKDEITPSNLEMHIPYSMPPKELTRVIWAFLNDHPEFYWLEISFNYRADEETDEITDIQLICLYNSSERKTINEALNKIILRFQQKYSYATDKEIVKELAEYIVKHCNYEVNDERNQNAASCLYFHKAQCSGISRAFKLVLDNLGIPCIFVEGKEQGNLGRDDHAWNMCEVDGDYYHCDITWMMGKNEKSDTYYYSYLLDSDDLMKEDHVWGMYKYPKCPKDIYFPHIAKDGDPVIPCKSYNDLYRELKNIVIKRDKYAAFELQMHMNEITLDAVMKKLEKIIVDNDYDSDFEAEDFQLTENVLSFKMKYRK